MFITRARTSRLRLLPAVVFSSLPTVALAVALASCGESSVTRTAEVSSISLTPPNATLMVGSTLTLEAAVDAAGAAAPEVFWSTSDATVATVTSDGVVRALKAGRANIAATALGNSAVSSILVNSPPVIPPVLPAAVATVSVSLSSSSIAVDKTSQATAVVRSSNGTALSGRTITWSTSAANIATVSASGVVTAKKPGSATITATSEGKSGSATVTITNK